MKYMGSKRWMLENGLGKILEHTATNCRRFVDLFTGSGVVAFYVAKRSRIPVAAYDLQEFSVVLASAIVERCEPLAAGPLWKDWDERAYQFVAKTSIVSEDKFNQIYVEKCRDWCQKQKHLPMTKAYGGHYFCPKQAVWLDALRATLPRKAPERTVALAGLIQAASQCAAAPGHTAQPFQPTRTAKKFLKDAWEKDILGRTEHALKKISQQYALTPGKAEVADANDAAKRLREGDLVFVDPPYSSVQYSRFYHVLESIARGECGQVSGAGRYPDFVLRPHSKFSLKSESKLAFSALMKTIADRNCCVIVTFPDHECSNGLSGEGIRSIAKKFFRLKEKVVSSEFSTLGGTERSSRTGNIRSPRQHAKELILYLRPK
jgi:adenine-specific DNA-methyltransferase